MSGNGGELLRTIFHDDNRRFPLVEKNFKVSSTGYARSARRIVDTTDLEALLYWITPEIIGDLEDSEKELYAGHLVMALRRRLGVPLPKADLERVSRLPVFKKIVAVEVDSGTTYGYTSQIHKLI
jgi:hypothetical protein